MCNCVVPPDHLLSENSFSRTCEIPHFVLYIYFTGLLLLETLHWFCVYMLVEFSCVKTNISSVYNFLRGNTARKYDFINFTLSSIWSRSASSSSEIFTTLCASITSSRAHVFRNGVHADTPSFLRLPLRGTRLLYWKHDFSSVCLLLQKLEMVLGCYWQHWNCVHSVLLVSKRIGDSTAVGCPPLNRRVRCSIHRHWVNRRSAPLARATTSSASAKSKISGFGMPSAQIIRQA